MDAISSTLPADTLWCVGMACSCFAMVHGRTLYPAAVCAVGLPAPCPSGPLAPMRAIEVLTLQCSCTIYRGTDCMDHRVSNLADLAGRRVDGVEIVCSCLLLEPQWMGRLPDSGLHYVHHSQLHSERFLCVDEYEPFSDSHRTVCRDVPACSYCMPLLADLSGLHSIARFLEKPSRDILKQHHSPYFLELSLKGQKYIKGM